jgi:hypothetical protein
MLTAGTSAKVDNGTSSKESVALCKLGRFGKDEEEKA